MKSWADSSDFARLDAAPHADVVKRRAWLGPLIHCWLTYLVAPINGLGYPQVQGMGPDMRHPRRSLFR